MLERYSSKLGLILVSFGLDYNGGFLRCFESFEGSIHATQLYIVIIGVLLRSRKISIEGITRVLKKLSGALVFLLFYSILSPYTANYGSYKFDLYVWSLMIVFLITVSISTSDSYRALIFLGVLQMSASIMFMGLDPTEFRTGVGSPITASRIGGFLIIFMLFAGWYNLLVRIGLGLFGLVVLLISGTRTPLIALAFLLLVQYGSTVFSRGAIPKPSLSQIIRICLLAIITITFIILNPIGINVESVERVFSAFNSLSNFTTSDGSTQERLLEWKMSLNAWFDSPFLGCGTGCFGYLWFRRDQPMYPHNLFLEVLSENGLIGLLFFITWINQVIPNRHIWSNIDVKFALSVFLYAIITGLTSLDMPNQFLLFISIALMIIVSNLYDKSALYFAK